MLNPQGVKIIRSNAQIKQNLIDKYNKDRSKLKTQITTLDDYKHNSGSNEGNSSINKAK